MAVENPPPGRALSSDAGGVTAVAAHLFLLLKKLALRHTLSYPWVIRASLVFIIRTRHLVLLVCIPAESRLRLSLPARSIGTSRTITCRWDIKLLDAATLLVLSPLKSAAVPVNDLRLLSIADLERRLSSR
jgi:hypothetical protein